MPVRTVPLGLLVSPSKVEEADIEEGQRWRVSERERRAKEMADSRRGYQEIWKRLDAAGPLPGMPRIPQVEMGSGAPQPTMAPAEDDPNRDMSDLGRSPKLSMRDIEGDPIPAKFQQRDGVGGPEQEQPPEDELAAIEAELARRELADVEAELQRRGGSEPADPRSIDSAINESVQQIPGGYEKWLNETQPAREGMRYERDPLSKSGKFAEVPVDPAERTRQTERSFGVTPEGTAEPTTQEDIADLLDKGADFLLAPITGRQTDPENDPVKAVSSAFVEPTVRLPASAVRDPMATFEQIDPAHMAARSYNAATTGLGQLMKGDLGGAAQSGYNATLEAGNAALGVLGARAAIKPNTGLGGVPEKAAVREPTVKQAGKTLAATAVPNRPIRPQAMKAIEKILLNGNVPRDRIAAGLTKVVESLQGFVDGSGKRPITVAQALKREFGEEFPEVRQNIDTVRLERRLTRKRGDASPAIVREAVQDMRGSQVDYLTESATKNTGATTRNATRKDMEAQLSEFGEEGYQPIISQPIDATRAKAIQDVLTGPGMSELGKPLRQIAAGEGKTIEQMIQESPLKAAHWMQHKARLLAEENGGTTLGNAYTSMRNRILGTIDDLATPEGQTYKDLRTQYAETAKIGTDLKAGDQFGALVKNPEKANAFVEKFETATPAQKEAQLASIGDWVLSKLRGGGEEAAARTAELQNIAVLDTLDRLGAQGKALADDIRAIRDEEADLARFFPKSESATVSNLEAQRSGPDIYSKKGGKISNGGSALADGAMMAADVSKLPILSIFSKAREAVQELGRPRTATREDMTKVLMSRPGKGRPAGAGGPPVSSGPARGDAMRAAREAGDLEGLMAASGDDAPGAQRWAVKDMIDARQVGALLDKMPPERAGAIRAAVKANDIDKAHDLINKEYPNIGRDISAKFMDAIDQKPLPKGVQLTDKQATVWQMMDEGASHRDVAKKLGLEYDTLEEIEAANQYIDVMNRSIAKKLHAAGHVPADPNAARLRSILGPNADKVLPKKKPPTD